MKDLAPEILRQRLVIEGLSKKAISDHEIKEYLSNLSIVLEMKELLEPVTHRSTQFGWLGGLDTLGKLGCPFLRMGAASFILQCGYLHMQGV